MDINQKWDLTTEAEKGYLAGIIDGEGCIHLEKYQQKGRPCASYNLRIRVSMTDIQAPLFLYNKFGGNFYTYQSKNLKAKKTYIWQIVNSKGINFLRYIQPYLLVKKNQADVALKFIATLYKPVRHIDGKFSRTRLDALDEREKLKQEMNFLNQRGIKEEVIQ